MSIEKECMRLELYANGFISQVLSGYAESPTRNIGTSVPLKVTLSPQSTFPEKLSDTRKN